jgi:hypothetical protein
MIFHNFHLFFFVKTFIFRFLKINRLILLFTCLLILHIFCLSNRGGCRRSICSVCLFLFWVIIAHRRIWLGIISRNKLLYIRRFSIRSRWKHISIRRVWWIFLFLIIIHHLRKIKTFKILLLFFNHRSIVTFLFYTCLRSFWTSWKLLILKS